jgi:hypothetical protein
MNTQYLPQSPGNCNTHKPNADGIAGARSRIAGYVPGVLQVAHDGVAGAVQHLAVLHLGLLPVAAGETGADLVRECGDQRGHHQQRVGVVAGPGGRLLPAKLLLLLVHGWALSCLVSHLHVARRSFRAWVNHAQHRGGISILKQEDDLATWTIEM